MWRRPWRTVRFRGFAGIVGAILFYTVASLILTFPLVLHLGDAVHDLGDPLLNTWILAWDAHAFATNPLKLYQANIFYPFPDSLTYSESLVGGALFASPIIWITRNPILAHNLLTLLSFVLSGVGMYVLTRYLTGHRPGSLLAGVIFAFCSYRIDQLSHLQLLMIEWLPFALFFLHRAFGGGKVRDFLWFALFFTLQALSSFYYAFFATLAVGVFLVYEFLAFPSSRRVAILARFGLAVMICGLVIIPLGLPYFQIQKTFGFSRGLGEVQDLSASFQDYFAAPPGNLLYGALTKPFTSHTKWPMEHFIFPGLLGPAMALLGIFSLRRPRAVSAHVDVEPRTQSVNLFQIDVSGHRDQLRYVVLLLFSFILSLGPHLQLFGHLTGIPLPYLFFYRYFPGFTAMRAPVRFDILVMLALAVLAGYGLARVDGYFRLAGWSSRFRWSAQGLVILLAATELAAVPLAPQPIKTGPSVPPVYRWLSNHDPNGPVAEMPVNQAQDFLYEYYSVYDWHPLLNGQSGFVPPAYPEVAAQINAFPSAKAVLNLRALGVRYLVVHGGILGRQRRLQIRKQAQAIKGVSLVGAFGTDDLYRLAAGGHAEMANVKAKLEVPDTVGRNAPAEAILVLKNPGKVPIVTLTPEAVAARVEWGVGQSSEVQELDLPLFLDPGAEDTVGIALGPLSVTGMNRLKVSVGSPIHVEEVHQVRVVGHIPTSEDRRQLAAATSNWSVPKQVVAGQTFEVRVRVTNRGHAEWLATPPRHQGQVGLGLRAWLTSSGKVADGPSGMPLGGRGWLPSNVLPGQTVSLTLRAVAPVQPGSYQLKLDMVSEFVTWFGDVHPGSSFHQQVEVVP